MTDTPLASVVVSNRDCAAYLAQAVDSALDQTYGRTEVVVVDDGSTDGSRDVIAGYNGDIVAVLQECSGQAATFNAGLEASHGEVVLFLDSDDALMPETVERAVDALDDEDAVKVHWRMWVVDEQGHRTGQLQPARHIGAGDLRDRVLRDGVVEPAMVPTSGNAWRRGFLEEVAPLRDCGDGLGADAYLCRLAPLYGALARLDEPQGLYRVHPGDVAGGRGRTWHLRRSLSQLDKELDLLREGLARQGVEVDVRDWKAPGSVYAHLRQALSVPLKVEAALPEGSTFVLVDDQQIGHDFFVDHRALPFLELGGEPFGPPVDDAQAIDELERMRGEGAQYVAIVADAYWWLDQYTEWADYLSERYACAHRDPDLLLYDLTRRPRSRSVPADRGATGRGASVGSRQGAGS